MKPTLRCLAVALAAGLFCNVAAAQVATVNGKPIPSERMDLILAEQTAQGAPDSAELRAAVRDELIQREILNTTTSRSNYPGMNTRSITSLSKPQMRRRKLLTNCAPEAISPPLQNNTQKIPAQLKVAVIWAGEAPTNSCLPSAKRYSL